MNTYLHLFSTTAEHDAVYNGSGYNEPWVALTESTDLITFNKRIDYKNTPGSIIYATSNGTIKATSREKWSASLGTPIGVVVIPASHMADGKCRAMSLCNMSYVTPETGTLATYHNSGDETTNGFNLMWGVYNNDISQLTNYTTIAGKDGIINGGGYLPSDYFKGMTSIEIPDDDTYDVTTEDNLIDTETAWWTEIGEGCEYDCNGGDNLILSPYAADGSRNASCNAAGQALADMDGASNTDILVGLSAISGQTTGDFENIQANYPAAMACHMFHTTGTTQGSWYLPSMGELAYLYVRVKEINTSLTTLGSSAAIPFGVLGGDGSLGSWCWSSSESSSNGAWNLLNNGIAYNFNKGNNNYLIRVRAFAAFDL